MATERAALGKAIEQVARATNWRVREIEPAVAREMTDKRHRLEIVQTERGWQVLTGSDDATRIAHATEDDAWVALLQAAGYRLE